jgi:hypothetical protein
MPLGAPVLLGIPPRNAFRMGESGNGCAKPLYSCGSEYPSFVTLRHLKVQSQDKKQGFPHFFVGFMLFPSVFAHFCPELLVSEPSRPIILPKRLLSAAP